MSSWINFVSVYVSIWVVLKDFNAGCLTVCVTCFYCSPQLCPLISCIPLYQLGPRVQLLHVFYLLSKVDKKLNNKIDVCMNGALFNIPVRALLRWTRVAQQ